MSQRKISSTLRIDCVGGRIVLFLAMFGFMAAVVATMSGCGKTRRDRGIVTGKVTYKGKTLQFGTVIFEPETGQYATGLIQPDGTFQMKTRGEGEGVPVGKSKVRFVCFAGQDPSVKPDAPSRPVHGETVVMGKSLIPQKYLSSETSGITVDVKPGNNEPIIFGLTDNQTAKGTK